MISLERRFELVRFISYIDDGIVLSSYLNPLIKIPIHTYRKSEMNFNNLLNWVEDGVVNSEMMIDYFINKKNKLGNIYFVSDEYNPFIFSNDFIMFDSSKIFLKISSKYMVEYSTPKQYTHIELVDDNIFDECYNVSYSEEENDYHYFVARDPYVISNILQNAFQKNIILHTEDNFFNLHLIENDLNYKVIGEYNNCACNSLILILKRKDGGDI